MAIIPKTLGELLYWSYDNLAMAHAAVSQKAVSYNKEHFMIRSRLYSGLLKGTMNIGDIAEEEKLKMKIPQACCYCVVHDNLSVDHIIPKKRKGKESGDNFIWSSRSCNSSKSAKDMLEWLSRRSMFPSLLLLRRYLKLVIGYCVNNGCMNLPLDKLGSQPISLPFSISHILHNFPKPMELKLWIIPLDEKA